MFSFGNQISKYRSFEKGLFLTYFSYFSHQRKGKKKKKSFSTYITKRWPEKFSWKAHFLVVLKFKPINSLIWTTNTGLRIFKRSGKTSPKAIESRAYKISRVQIFGQKSGPTDLKLLKKEVGKDHSCHNPWYIFFIPSRISAHAKP